MCDPNVIEAIKVLSEHIDETARLICILICVIGLLVIVAIPSPQRILKEILKGTNRVPNSNEGRK